MSDTQGTGDIAVPLVGVQATAVTGTLNATDSGEDSFEAKGYSSPGAQLAKRQRRRDAGSMVQPVVRSVVRPAFQPAFQRIRAVHISGTGDEPEGVENEQSDISPPAPPTPRLDRWFGASDYLPIGWRKEVRAMLADYEADMVLMRDAGRPARVIKWNAILARGTFVWMVAAKILEPVRRLFPKFPV